MKPTTLAVPTSSGLPILDRLLADLPAYRQPPYEHTTRWSEIGHRPDMYRRHSEGGWPLSAPLGADVDHPAVQFICEHPAIVHGIRATEVLKALGIAGRFDPAILNAFQATIDKGDLPVKVRDLSPLLDKFGEMALAIMTRHGKPPERGLTLEGATVQRLPLSDLATTDQYVTSHLPPAMHTGSWRCVLQDNLSVTSTLVPSPAEYAALRRRMMGTNPDATDAVRPLDNFGDWAHHDAETAASLVTGLMALALLEKSEDPSSGTKSLLTV